MPLYGSPYQLPQSAVQVQGPYGSPSPYYQWNNSYGSPWQTPNGFLETPLGKIGANQQDAAYFQRSIAPWAGGNDPFSRFVQGQQSRVLSGLDQARLTNPNLSITDYLPGVASYDTFLRQFRRQDPGARGERWSTFAPRTRLMGY